MATGPWYEIPLSPQAQSFYIPIGATTYYLTFIYRDCLEGGWFMDISDSLQNPLVQGIPLVTGCDLVQAYPEKNFGFSMIIGNDNNSTFPPTYADLGVSSHLYFGIIT